MKRCILKPGLGLVEAETIGLHCLLLPYAAAKFYRLRVIGRCRFQPFADCEKFAVNRTVGMIRCGTGRSWSLFPICHYRAIRALWHQRSGLLLSLEKMSQRTLHFLYHVSETPGQPAYLPGAAGQIDWPPIAHFHFFHDPHQVADGFSHLKIDGCSEEEEYHAKGDRKVDGPEPPITIYRIPVLLTVFRYQQAAFSAIQQRRKNRNHGLKIADFTLTIPRYAGGKHWFIGCIEQDNLVTGIPFLHIGRVVFLHLPFHGFELHGCLQADSQRRQGHRQQRLVELPLFFQFEELLTD
jgi:hypothetical protein